MDCIGCKHFILINDGYEITARCSRHSSRNFGKKIKSLELEMNSDLITTLLEFYRSNHKAPYWCKKSSDNHDYLVLFHHGCTNMTNMEKELRFQDNKYFVISKDINTKEILSVDSFEEYERALIFFENKKIYP